LRDERPVVEQLQSLKVDGLAASIISVAELYEGVYKASEPEQAERIVRSFLSQVSVVGVYENVSRFFG
jgi:tRNA(fMet)-specific endonuclease VapC